MCRDVSCVLAIRRLTAGLYAHEDKRVAGA